MIDKGTLNVIQLSFTFMLQFFAYMSQEFIQEPLIESESRHRGSIDKHAGYNSFAILYFFFTLSCLIITPIVEKLTAKWSMVIGLIAYILFQIGFFHINTIYLYVTSGILGVGAALLWVGQGKYLTENCTAETVERNTSLSWMIFKVSLLGGGIFLFFMFQHQTLIEFVENDNVTYLCIIFCTISILAAINTIFLPKSAYQPENPKVESLFETLCSTFQLMKTNQMLLLSVIFIYAGFSRSFWIAIYPACVKFTSKLGSNTTKILAQSCIATGCGQIMAGIILSIIGRSAKIVGRDLIVVFSVLLHLSIYLLIYLFFPYDAPLHQTDNIGHFEPNHFLAVCCSGGLGFGDAILQLQIYSFLVDGYSNESSHAFALFKFYSGASSTLAFFISRSFVLSSHLILYASTAILSAITAVLAQRLYFHKEQHFSAGNLKIAPTEIEISGAMMMTTTEKK